uniref:Nucleotid_trans domain-containing protein n=1 Tax=Meloidogyne hapla TaxID=6305 RepID=A0A1I8BXR7_MELHA
MSKHSEFEWILFIDGDMAVVNPNHSLFEYINGEQIIFYDRLFNHEIMAGSYLAKNFGDLFKYEVCVRHYIAKQMINRTFDEGKVRVLPKALGWARDGGHTRTKFSTKDFMFHGWKYS